MNERERKALAEAIEHCAMHNREYHHVTPQAKITEWQNVLGEATMAAQLDAAVERAERDHCNPPTAYRTGSGEPGRVVGLEPPIQRCDGDGASYCDGETIEVPVTRRARVTLVGRVILGGHNHLARWGQTEAVELKAGDVVAVRCGDAPWFRPGTGRVMAHPSGTVADLSDITGACDGDLLYRVEPER